MNRNIREELHQIYDALDKMMVYCPKTNPGILDIRDRGTCCDNAAFCARKATIIYETLAEAGQIDNDNAANKISLDIIGSACSGGHCDRVRGALDNIIKSAPYKDAQRLEDDIGEDKIVLFKETPLVPQKYVDAMNHMIEAEIPKTGQQVPVEPDTPLPSTWKTDIKEAPPYIM